MLLKLSGFKFNLKFYSHTVRSGYTNKYSLTNNVLIITITFDFILINTTFEALVTSWPKHTEKTIYCKMSTKWNQGTFGYMEDCSPFKCKYQQCVYKR